MLELILSTIIFISPGDSTQIPFDITIVFDPPLDPKSITIYLDEIEIEGKKESDYFYRIIESLLPGLHSIKVVSDEKIKEYNFIVIGEDRISLETWGNLSLGIHNYYYRDTLYPEESGPIYGLDMTLLKGNYSLNVSLLHDPDYPSEWYPFISLHSERLFIEGGYIYPFLDEITIFSSDGFGISGEIDIGPITLSPFFLYSKNYDTLFSEYPRLFYGGKIDFFNNAFHLGFTLFNACDDTSNLTGFTLTSPKKSLVISPEITWKLSDEFMIKLKGGYSNSNNNLYADIPINGNVFEGNIIYERDFNNITIGVRRTSDDYLTLGNPFLYTGRTETFLSGIYEEGRVYTDFDHLLYNENGDLGFSLMQTLKMYLSNYLSPIFEFQWIRLPEYEDEDYQYVAVGFESKFENIRIYNIIGIYKNLTLDASSSLKLSSSLYWYPALHSVGIGGVASFDEDHVRFDLDLSLYLKLWNLGYLDIIYYPSFEDGYDNHSLRILFEYEF